MSLPLGLSIEQFAAINDAANTLKPAQRARFFTTVDAMLNDEGKAVITNAAVSSAIDAGLRALQVVG